MEWVCCFLVCHARLRRRRRPWLLGQYVLLEINGCFIFIQVKWIASNCVICNTFKIVLGLRFLHSTLSPYEHEVLRHKWRLLTAAPLRCCVTASFPLSGHFRRIFLLQVSLSEKRWGRLNHSEPLCFFLIVAGYYLFNATNRLFVLKIQRNQQLFCQCSTKDTAKNQLFFS